MYKEVCQPSYMVRIDKRTARKLFNEGEIIYLVPCNIRPLHSAFTVSIHRKLYDETFDSMVNTFIGYNCGAKTGYYPMYFVEKHQ